MKWSRKRVALALVACEFACASAAWSCSGRPSPGTVPVVSDTPVPPIATEADPDAASPENVTGTITETMDSGGYTYVKLATSRGEKWAAVPRTDVVVGDRFTVSGAHEMTGFSSTTLGRTFDRIYFGTAGGGYQQIARMHGGSSLPQVPDTLPIMKKADGPTGQTIADLLANRASLKGKEVSVRGQVVRYTAGVLGANWIHLRDGTAGRNGQITVTTMGTAAIGEVVLATGIVRLDRDFGAGNLYPVLLDQAKLER